MDRFLNTRRVKKNLLNFTTSNCVCIWGPEGTGKTWLAEQTNGIHMTDDVLRSKQNTLDFIDRVHSTDQAVILDDYETMKDLVGFRELTGPPSLGPFILTGRHPAKLSFPVENYEIPIPTPERITCIVLGLRPNARPELVQRLAASANGSIRNVLSGLDFPSDHRDFFQDPKKDCEVLFVKGVTGRVPTFRDIHEHGYMWNVVQENYLDGPKLELGAIADCAESLSATDLFDEKMYRDQSWELMGYFCALGIFFPASLVGKSLKGLRKGAMWTKFQNMCVKAKKIEEFKQRYGVQSELLDFYVKIGQIPKQDLTTMKKMCTFGK